MSDLVFAWIIIAIATNLYFIPAWVAFARGHRNAAAIFVCNTLFGWTFIGWGGSLIWAFA